MVDEAMEVVVEAVDWVALELVEGAVDWVDWVAREAREAVILVENRSVVAQRVRS